MASQNPRQLPFKGAALWLGRRDWGPEGSPGQRWALFSSGRCTRLSKLGRGPGGLLARQSWHDQGQTSWPRVGEQGPPWGGSWLQCRTRCPVRPERGGGGRLGG